MIPIVDSKDVPGIRIEDVKDKEEDKKEARWEVSGGIGILGWMRCKQSL